MAATELRGQRALVTGASSGIGMELARQLAMRGADVVVTARRADKLEALATELRAAYEIDARVIAADLLRPGASMELFDATEGAGLPIDILVNNAGFGPWKPFTETPWELHASVVQVNITTPTHLTALFLPPMLQRKRGRIVNVASVGAFTPTPRFAVYTATKAYVRDFTEALDQELIGTGVRAQCICPGGTATGFLEVAGQHLKRGRGGMLMSAERCARIGLDKVLAGRRLVVVGLGNNAITWALRLVPRRAIPWIAERSMRVAVEPKP